MHLANGDIPVSRSRLPDDPSAVDRTVEKMVEMAKGQYGARSAKIRALAINIVNDAHVADKDYYGMIVAIHNWVRDTVRYVKDPVGQETLSYPEETAFNSLAGDCDDKTILEMALLGSIGLRSYPVVIGMQAPGHYSHVYLHAMVPAGKGRAAGQIIPCDPIMREWPVGKEAPAYKVKAKKLYSDLSGLAMLDGYADASDYLDTRNLASVVPVLRGRTTNSAGGSPVNTKQVVASGETVDDMFGPGISLKGRNSPTNPMRAATKADLFARGPLTNLSAENATSYLHAAPVRPMRAGQKVLTVRMPQQAKTAVGPTVGEMLGLADYLSALDHAITTGRGDTLNRAAAAAHYTKARARKANRNLYTINRHVALAGLSGDVPAEAVVLARKTAELADALSRKAAALAARAAGNSPGRRAALNGALGLLGAMDENIALTDIVAAQPAAAGADWYDDAAAKVQTVTHSMFDSELRRAARPASAPNPAAGRTIIKNPLAAGSVVRDHNGDAVTDDGALAGFFSSVNKKLKKIASHSPVKKVADLHKTIAQKVVAQHTNALRLVGAPGIKKASSARSTKAKPASTGAIIAPPTAQASSQPYARKKNGKTHYYLANGTPISKAQYTAWWQAYYNPTPGTPIIDPNQIPAYSTGASQPASSTGPAVPSVSQTRTAFSPP